MIIKTETYNSNWDQHLQISNFQDGLYSLRTCNFNLDLKLEVLLLLEAIMMTLRTVVGI